MCVSLVPRHVEEEKEPGNEACVCRPWVPLSMILNTEHQRYGSMTGISRF